MPGLGRHTECGFDGFACIKMFFILIDVLYTSRSLTLVTMIYNWYILWAQVAVLLMLWIILDSWDICCEYNAGAQEVIFTRYSCI